MAYISKNLIYHIYGPAVAPLKQELIYQYALIIQQVNEALGEKVIEEVVIQ